MPINDELLEVLVCPLTKGRLKYDEIQDALIGVDSGACFSIRNGIPMFVSDVDVK
jgi:uncharacterized protein YbaR (Trm112 family)